ncbi:MAG: hypothetical protein ACPGU1_12785 [Myxococcota bacterium]
MSQTFTSALGTFWRRNRGVIMPLSIGAILLALWGVQAGSTEGATSRCGEACAAQMRGEPGVQWVAKYADGPGYQALLACMNEGMSKGQKVDGMACWDARLDACRLACAAAEVTTPTP